MIARCVVVILLICLAPLAVAQNDGVSHVVLAWFKAGTSPEYIAAVEDHSQVLREIPGVLEIRTGAALASERPVVDASYDLAIYVYFATVEDLQRYLSHPTHVSFVKQWVKPHLERMQVYDFRAR